MAFLILCPPAVLGTVQGMVSCVQAVAGNCGDISVISIVDAQVLFLLKGLQMLNGRYAQVC